MFKGKYSDAQIIKAIRAGGQERERAWEYIYKIWRNPIIWVIFDKWGGTKEEAIEAFHGAYEDFEARIRQPDFELNGQLLSYLITCVYHQFLRDKKRGGKANWMELDEKKMEGSLTSMDPIPLQPDLKAAVMASLEKIGSRCKEILVLFYFEGTNMKKIAQKLGFKGGEQVAKNEKRKCMARYEDFLRNHPQVVMYLKDLRDE